MNAIDFVGLLVPLTYFLFLATEKPWPARQFPPRKGWHWFGIVFLLLVGTLSTVVPLLLPLDWMAAHRWLDGTRLGVVGGTLLGYLVLSAIMYAWHRTVHNVPLLWRAFHQIHHSPNRVDIPGSVLFHPTEIILQVLLQLFVTVIVLGLDPLAAALVGYVAAFYGMFQHWNVRTPQWLGVLIQRPEAHCEHHRMGCHSSNYGDFPLWDILLGTFRNPVEFRGECGFENGADRKLLQMLAFVDVNEAAYGGRNLGQQGEAGRSSHGEAMPSTQNLQT
ncbi:MAG TPA: sterol desaturase family protein [Dokdonella sp.]|jgi:sterol desaturase/sphingolipid hydroxylase (fatty acid hydroxylase superfamily)|nr:sterol desaturase family protein [Dokdonella sp.]